MKRVSNNSNSNFWLNKDSFNFVGESNAITKRLKLLAYKKAISNFVKILIRRDDFNVKFSTGDDSYTNGTTVVISSKLNEDNFDVTVGLALHEASHLLLTDFKLINDKNEINKITLSMGPNGLKMNNKFLHQIHNIVEDRYIDTFVYNSAPGYRGYYNSLYDYYFRNKKITARLKSKKYLEVHINNYINQLINIVSPDFDENALPGLKEIVDILDIKNISRLKTTYDRLIVAANIYSKIIDCISLYAEIKNKNNGVLITPPSNVTVDIDDEDTKDDEGYDGDDLGMSSKDDNLDLPGMTAAEEIEADELISKRNTIVNGGKVDTDSLSVRESSSIDILEKSDAELVMTTFENSNVETLIIKNVTMDLVLSGLMPNAFKKVKTEKLEVEGVIKGISYGSMLAKRISSRNDVKQTVTTRLNNGKVFGRHVALLGADVENIFYKTKIEEYNKSTIHISIDASASMGGTKFIKSICTAVAIAKAASLLNGVNCIINIRTVIQDLPATIIIYNSFVDHISKILEIFPYINCSSTTPEGLCYATYVNIINNLGDKTADKFLINLSDGEPQFTIKNTKISYEGERAFNQSKQAWNNILKTGVVGLSYFIHNGYYSKNDEKVFKDIYGNDSKIIDVENLLQLSNSINDMLVRNTSIKTTVC